MAIAALSNAGGGAGGAGVANSGTRLTHQGRTRLSLVALRIVDAEMNEAPHDGATSGEIVVQAQWLTNGYFNSPDASEQLWAGVTCTAVTSE
jgi:acyl-CoA synthetase (AMP-forming)/AMP-acid ligase II